MGIRVEIRRQSRKYETIIDIKRLTATNTYVITLALTLVVSQSFAYLHWKTEN